ncbi:SBP domain-containing protein [Haematococcus lacustris]
MPAPGKLGPSLGETCIVASAPALRRALACQVDGCSVNLAACGKRYFTRHRCCAGHMKACNVLVGGVRSRFCQQCAKFHSVKDFDDDKKSCRKRLSQHNARRRRKPCNESENDDENDDATELLLSSSSSHASPSTMMGTSTCSCPDAQPHLSWQLPGALHVYPSTAAPPSLTFGKAQRLGSLLDLSDDHVALPGCVTEPSQHYSLGTMAISAPHCHILGPDKSRPGCQQHAAGQHPKGFSERVHAGRVCKTRSRCPSLSLLKSLQNHGQSIKPDELAEMLHGQGDYALQPEAPVEEILSSRSAHTRPALNSLPSVPGTGAMCIDGSSSCTDDSAGIGRHALTALPVNWPLSKESPGCMPLVREQQPQLLAQQRQPYSPAVMQGTARAQGNATLASSVPLPILADLHPSDCSYHAEGVGTAPLGSRAKCQLGPALAWQRL